LIRLFHRLGEAKDFALRHKPDSNNSNKVLNCGQSRDSSVRAGSLSVEAKRKATPPTKGLKCISERKQDFIKLPPFGLVVSFANETRSSALENLRGSTENLACVPLYIDKHQIRSRPIPHKII